METSSNSDGCSWVPDFWFKSCCEVHDLGGDDWGLTQCIIETAPPGYLPVAVAIGLIYFIGLKSLGWIYQLYKKKKRTDADNNRL